MRFSLTSALILLMTAKLWSQAGDSGHYAEESLLNTGKWHRITVTGEGVYRIGYAKLVELGFTNPSGVRIFGNNVGQLSFFNNVPSPDDLQEIPLEISKGQDGIFNEGDHIYFYAIGTHRWKFDDNSDKYLYLRHDYADTAVYFITEMAGSPEVIMPVAAPVQTANYSTGSYDVMYIREEETENLIRSGREWYQPMSVLRAVEVDPGFTGLVAGEPLSYRIRVAGRSPVPSMFRLLSGGETLLSLMVSEVNMYNTTGTYARYAESEGTIPYTPTPAFEVRFFNNGESSAMGWLDYIVLQGRARLIAGDKTLFFTDSRSVGEGLTNEYVIESNDPDVMIWDVTDPARPWLVETSRDGEYLKFSAPADSLRRFVTFKPGVAPAPRISSVPMENQNLHATGPCDMLIVAHPLFVTHAERLAALHYENSGLIARVVTPFQIYNEFSGGVPDVSAIRNFVRMVWLKHASSEHNLKYLLLFGDGSYENKTLPPANPNFIPTWQTRNSNIVVSSFMSDDFYGLLDEDEGEATGFLDIGIGRLPAYDTLTATALINKIDRYMNGSDPGNWRSLITLVADDEDGNLHMNDAENLASMIGTVNKAANIDKIYFDAFRQVTSINGQTYPDVTMAINNRIEQGTLIFNYMGHGNEAGLAHERVIKTVDINGWKNLCRLPLFITATCEFSRFDDVEYNIISGIRVPRTSAGELALLNPNGGAIALMSTTRVVFSAPNYILNRNIYSFAFEKDTDGMPLRLGDIIRLAKINSGSGTNKRNFSLLGDPALRLDWPADAIIVTDSLNSRHVSMPSDTLKALSEITLSGRLVNSSGDRLEGYSGTLHTTVFDKPVMVTTLANDGGPIFEFQLLNSVLFSGRTQVTDGLFTVSFMVPRDIDYNYGEGRISYYSNGDNMHAAGYFSNITVGGFSSVTYVDSTGPDIRLFLNDTLFRNGSMAGSDPFLLALISDENGLNTTGAGIGHDLTLWLNEDSNNSVVVNNYYESDFSNFRKGTMKYQLRGLKQGLNSITLKAWDNYNNSSLETLWFVVGDDLKFVVGDIINYPNPFTSGTTIVASHNRPDNNIDVEIVIWDMAGRKIQTLKGVTPAGGYSTFPIYWDRTAADGSKVARGTYIFRMTLRTDSHEIAAGSGRMIIL